MSIHVVKIGGSLVTRVDFVPALQTWVKAARVAEPQSHLVLLVGGGEMVDSLRALDGRCPIAPELAHWSAIEAMEILGKVVANWFPQWPTESDIGSLRDRCEVPGATIFLAHEFLRRVEPLLPGDPLPVGWHVTSDSISARLAEILGATRLTLLKSALPGEGSWTAAAQRGYVDAYFPHAISGLAEVGAKTLPDRAGASREAIS